MELSVRSKRLRSALNAFCCFSFSFGTTLFGQTLQDIQCHLQVELSEVSHGLVLNSLFFAAGSLLCGWLYGILNRQKLYVAQFAILGFGFALIPSLNELLHFYALHVVLGFSMGGLITTLSVLDLEIWGSESGPYIQGVQFCGALGATLASMANQLLSDPSSHENHKCHNSATVTYSYKVAAVLTLLSASLLGFLEFAEPYESSAYTGSNSNNESQNKDVNDNSKGERVLPTSYNTAVIALGAIVLSLFFCVHFNSGTYLTHLLSACESEISLKSSELNSIFFATVTAVSGLSIPIAGKIKAHVMLYLCFALVLISNLVILTTSAHQNMSIMLAAIVIFAAGLPCAPPAIYRFIQDRVPITNGISSLFTFGSSVGPAIGMVIIGSEAQGNPFFLSYFNVMVMLVVCCAFTALHCTDLLRRNFIKEAHKKQE